MLGVVAAGSGTLRGFVGGCTDGFAHLESHEPRKFLSFLIREYSAARASHSDRLWKEVPRYRPYAARERSSLTEISLGESALNSRIVSPVAGFTVAIDISSGYCLAYYDAMDLGAENKLQIAATCFETDEGKSQGLNLTGF